MATFASAALRPDKAAAAAYARAAADQALSTAAEVADPDRPVLGTWSTRALVTHLAAAARFYTELVRGGASPVRAWAELPQLTEAQIEAERGEDFGAQVVRARGDVAAFVDAALAVDGDPEVAWHFGVPMPVSCLLGTFVGEAVVHGWDVASAARRPWRIPPEWAHTTLRAMLPFVAHTLDARSAAGVDSAYDIRMRGGGPRIVLRIRNGQLTVHRPGEGGRIDAYLAGDPLALLLVIYGRTGPLVPALRGKALAWGRRPWRALTMTRYFQTI